MKNQRKMALLAAAMLEEFPDLVSGYVVDARIESLNLRKLRTSQRQSGCSSFLARPSRPLPAN